MPDLKVADTSMDYRSMLGETILGACAGKKTDILEAGCGTKWALDLGSLDYHLTGVDVDERALKIRTNEKKDLDRAVLGDLRDPFVFPSQSFDIIYCHYVLEHVSDAKKALENLVAWTRSGGLIVLLFPDRDSSFGFLSRNTPFWLHVLFRKFVTRDPHAGEEGYLPYPVFYDRVLSRKNLDLFCKDHGLVVKQRLGLRGFEHFKWRKYFLNVWRWIVTLLSLGKYSHKHDNLLYVLQKTPPPAI